MLRPDLLGNLAGVRLIGLNLLPSLRQVGCAFKGNANGIKQLFSFVRSTFLNKCRVKADDLLESGMFI